MSAASNYTEANIYNALLRGVAFPLPTGTYVSLHTADPGDTGANEVSLAAWPGYVRKSAEDGGAIGAGWAAPTDGVGSNLKQLTFPPNDGTLPVTVTHIGIWDAATAGNCLTHSALSTSRTLLVGDVIVFNIGQITVTVA